MNQMRKDCVQKSHSFVKALSNRGINLPWHRMCAMFDAAV